METVVTIGGKRFTKVDVAKRSVRHDHFMAAVFRKTGVDRITPTADELKEPTEFLIRMHNKLIASTHACEVLSAFLIPEGTPQSGWSPAIAQKVQVHIESANTEDDRQLVNQLAFEVMTGFFRRGLLLLLKTLGSSLPSGDQDESEPLPNHESKAV